MADRWYNVPLGGDMKEDVSEGAADTSQFVGVRITYDATGNSKLQALKALDAVRDYITQDNWAPV